MPANILAKYKNDNRKWYIPGDHRISGPTIAQTATVPKLWHMPIEIFEPIWAMGITGKGITIAINDTGVNAHTNLPKPRSSRNFTSSPGGGDVDRNGHATHCAGIALGRDGLGCAPEAELISTKILGDNGSGDTRGINAGRVWAASEGADIISESIGGPQGNRADEDSIAEAYSLGVSLCTAAAGNDGYRGTNTIGYPGRYLATACVGSYNMQGNISTYSSGGREIDVATPGENIVSANYRGGYISMDGTSMACPHFSGLMALAMHKMQIIGLPRLHGIDEWRSWWQSEGFMQDAGTPGKDVRFGLGKPMIVNMLNWLKEPLNV